MAGGTLVVSRDTKNYSTYQKKLETLGYSNITFTAVERDALYFRIVDTKPNLVLVEANFYECCTPFIIGELLQQLPNTKIAAVSIGKYPCETAMYFILNGIESYLTTCDGFDVFYQGLVAVRKGGEYVSPDVLERIEMRREYPMPAGKITERHKQVIRLVCCGYKDKDVAETLAISRKTVTNHKTEIFTSLNVTSPIELVRAALTLGIVKQEEIYFYPDDLALNPKPVKKKASMPFS